MLKPFNWIERAASYYLAFLSRHRYGSRCSSRCFWEDIEESERDKGKDYSREIDADGSCEIAISSQVIEASI